MKSILDEGGVPPLPDIRCAYLFNIFLEVGPCLSTGFGRVRLTQQEIARFQENQQIRLQPWECQTLVRLSDAWIEQAAISDDYLCPPPYIDAPTVDMRERVADQIDRLL